jgi:hypothetical protein
MAATRTGPGPKISDRGDEGQLVAPRANMLLEGDHQRPRNDIEARNLTLHQPHFARRHAACGRASTASTDTA